MKITRLKNSGELELINEIIEYPSELAGNRNLFTGLYTGHANHPNYNMDRWTGAVVKIKPNTTYTVKRWGDSNRFQVMTGRLDNGIYAKMTGTPQIVGNYNENHIDVSLTITSREDDEYLVVYLSNEGHFEDILLKVEEGSTATPYIASPEELGYEYPDYISSFKPRVYSHGVVLTEEIVEFPIELTGKRNLFSGEFYKDINNYDDVLVYRYHLTDLESNKRYAVRSWLKEGETPATGFWITLTSGHPNPNSASANGGTYSHIISNGNPTNSQVRPRDNVPVYVSYYPPAADLSVLERYDLSIEQLDSGYITEWKPAPYDLGVNYTSDIDSFGIRPLGEQSMVSELIEGGTDISTGKGNGMSSSSMYSSSYSPQNLVDGNITFGANRAFASANNAPLPQWFQIDLGDIYYVDTVRWINNRTNARLPGDYRIEASTTGEFNGEEILVASKVGNTSYDWVEHRFSDTKCRYVRMTVTKIYAGSYFELAEWQIFGYPAVIDSY